MKIYMSRAARCHLLLILILFLAVLPACSQWKKQETAYLKSELLPPLKTPPGLEAPRTNEFMAIPEVTAEQNMPDGERAIDAPPELVSGEK